MAKKSEIRNKTSYLRLVWDRAAAAPPLVGRSRKSSKQPRNTSSSLKALGANTTKVSGSKKPSSVVLHATVGRDRKSGETGVQKLPFTAAQIRFLRSIRFTPKEVDRIEAWLSGVSNVEEILKLLMDLLWHFSPELHEEFRLAICDGGATSELLEHIYGFHFIYGAAPNLAHRTDRTI